VYRSIKLDTIERGELMLEIETRTPNDKLGNEWTNDIGNGNEFANETSAWAMVEELKTLGGEWATAEYRVVPMENSCIQK
jgi:hypothetical protein